MTITRVVGKGRTELLGEPELAALRSSFARVAVDLGTGDGRFPYQLATDEPRLLVLGIDALAAPMGERAAVAARKPARGGRPNLVYVHAAVEALPAELTRIADEVYVQLPWGALLEGIMLARPAVLSGIAAICRPGAHVAVTLNGEIWLESTPARYADLPIPTPDYVSAVIAPAFATFGVTLTPAHYASADAAKQLATTWARKLGHAREHPRFVQFEGVASAV